MYHSTSVIPEPDDAVRAYLSDDLPLVVFEGSGRFAVHVPHAYPNQAIAWIRSLVAQLEDLAEQIEMTANAETIDAAYAEPDPGLVEPYRTDASGPYTLAIYDDQPVPDGSKHAPEMRVTLSLNGEVQNEFTYPSYRIWTLLAHWKDGLPEPGPSAAVAQQAGIALATTDSEYADKDRGTALAAQHIAEMKATAFGGGER